MIADLYTCVAVFAMDGFYFVCLHSCICLFCNVHHVCLRLRDALKPLPDLHLVYFLRQEIRKKCNTMLLDAMPCNATPYHADIPCCFMPCHTTPCHAMLCYAML